MGLLWQHYLQRRGWYARDSEAMNAAVSMLLGTLGTGSAAGRCADDVIAVVTADVRGVTRMLTRVF